jgi:hypothetical protein
VLVTICDAKYFVIRCAGGEEVQTDMFAEKVEQNRELLYKFPLRDDNRHGAASHGRREGLRPNLARNKSFV